MIPLSIFNFVWRFVPTQVLSAAGVALLMGLFYEGLPVPQWLRTVPIAGPVAEALVDGRVDRVARSAVKDLVDRAELEVAQRLLRAAMVREELAKMEAAEIAKINADYIESLNRALDELETANAEIDDFAASQADDPGDVVGPDTYQRLRNK